MVNNKYTLFTTGYGCSCPEQRHVPKEECLEAAQSLLNDINNNVRSRIRRRSVMEEDEDESNDSRSMIVGASGSVDYNNNNGNNDNEEEGDFSSTSGGRRTNTEIKNIHIPNELVDNISKYSPCGCFVWKDRSKIIYADPEETICEPIEWAQLVCKQLEDTTSTSTSTSTNSNNKNNEGVGKEEEVLGEEEQEEGVSRRNGRRDLSTMNMVHDSGFPVNYTLGDQIFPPKEEVCSDWLYYRPIHLSDNPDFCIGLRGVEDIDINHGDDGDGDGDSVGGEKGKNTQVVLKSCEQLDTTKEYLFYDIKRGIIYSRVYYDCLEVGKDIGSPLMSAQCNHSKVEQKWYLHEDGKFQSLFDKSFIGVAECEISENVTIVSSHNDQDGCNQWLPYTMIFDQQAYGPGDLWAVFGVFIPLLIILTCIITTGFIQNAKRDTRDHRFHRRHLANGTQRMHNTSSGSGVGISALSNVATRDY